MPFSRELWIEADDFMEVPTKGYFRLAPGAEVRLRYAYVVKCVGIDKDAAGRMIAVHCTYDPDTRSGTPGADAKKVKGNIHWVSASHALPAEVRLFDRLFTAPAPGSRRGTDAQVGGKRTDPALGDEPEEGNWLADLNPASKEVLTAVVEPALGRSQPEERFQFERLGYFVADRFDCAPGALVFNRVVDLRDTWAKKS